MKTSSAKFKVIFLRIEQCLCSALLHKFLVTDGNKRVDGALEIKGHKIY